MTATAKPGDILLVRFGVRLAVKISPVRPPWPGSGVGCDGIRQEERGAPGEIEVTAAESAWLCAEPDTVRAECSRGADLIFNIRDSDILERGY